MSAFSGCQNIPSRRIILNDASQLPHDYSSTPGGTLYSTTPGGKCVLSFCCEVLIFGDGEG